MTSVCGRLVPALLALAAALPAHAQPLPAPPAAVGGSRVCTQLEAQLRSFDGGANDPARAERIQRQEEAVNKQQFELDRARSQQRQAGCESGFFLFGQPPQCGQLNARVQQARSALDRMQMELEQAQGGGAGPEREGQRRAILAALAQNDCGSQYRAAAAQQAPRGFFETLFGPGSVLAPIMPGDGGWSSSGTYKTVCVRTCDGFYYPISFATTPGKFAEDARVCQRSCPAAEVQLYSHRNPGEDMNQALSVGTQQPYTALPNAFAYRRAFDSGCSCRKPGESWSQALKHLEDQTVERGDIVVNEERARQLSQPRQDAQGRPIRPEPARGARPDPRAPTRTATPAAAEPTSPEGSEQPDPKRSVRTVGPQFYSR